MIFFLLSGSLFLILQPLFLVFVAGRFPAFNCIIERPHRKSTIVLEFFFVRWVPHFSRIPTLAKNARNGAPGIRRGWFGSTIGLGETGEFGRALAEGSCRQ